MYVTNSQKLHSKNDVWKGSSYFMQYYFRNIVLNTYKKTNKKRPQQKITTKILTAQNFNGNEKLGNLAIKFKEKCNS